MVKITTQKVKYTDDGSIMKNVILHRWSQMVFQIVTGRNLLEYTLSLPRGQGTLKKHTGLGLASCMQYEVIRQANCKGSMNSQVGPGKPTCQPTCKALVPSAVRGKDTLALMLYTLGLSKSSIPLESHATGWQAMADEVFLLPLTFLVSQSLLISPHSSGVHCYICPLQAMPEPWKMGRFDSCQKPPTTRLGSAQPLLPLPFVKHHIGTLQSLGVWVLFCDYSDD
jgi:hypothetical protein